MKSKPSNLFSAPSQNVEAFCETAKSVTEEFVDYCREHKVLPTYELFSRWVAALPGSHSHIPATKRTP